MAFLPTISFDWYGVLFLIFCTSVFIQLMYLLWFNLRLNLFKPREAGNQFPAVSVIICARNEEENLMRNLPFILQQKYPKFEVIVVNDQSIDGSNHALRELCKKYPHLKAIDIARNKHAKFGKKMPLTIGIKGAKYDRVALVDADCKPATENWLRHLMSGYTEGKEIVIGYSPYEREPGFLNRMIRFDTVSIAISYLSATLGGRPYMAVGRNMSYTTNVFFKAEGFKKHYHIQSGDDDLFMQDAATRKNVAVCLHPESFVMSVPKHTWSGWFQQKRRHYSASAEYRLINKLFLGIFPVSMFMTLFTLVILLIGYKWWAFVLAVFGLRIVAYWVVNGIMFRKLGSGDLVRIYPLLELVHFCIMPFVYYSIKGNQENKW